MKNMPEALIHPFPPVVDAHSRILILGSMPSRASRQQEFYYAHPRNRFWPVMERLGQCTLRSRDDKIKFLHQHGLALWDVIASCTITGSSDASIQNVVVNDFRPLLAASEIKTIVTTGKTAGRLYQKYAAGQTGIEALILPSTSPANAAVSLDQLTEAYRCLFEMKEE